jgi:ParB family chromosome partitioning protein
MARNSLGRGLGAIFEDVEEAYRQEIDDSVDIVKELNINDIKPNPYQPRKHFDENSLNELANSIKQHGLLQPIVVIQKDDGYVLIAGERRLRACKIAGLESIKSIVADIKSEKFRELALIENIQREDLNPIELAKSYKELIDEYQITQEELAGIVNKSRTQVTNTIRLLNLTQNVQELILSNRLTQGHAKVLVGLDEGDQKVVADTIVGQRLSVKETENLVKNIKHNNPPVKAKKKDGFRELESLSSSLKELGFRSVVGSNFITLKFQNSDEIESFKELVDRLKGQE